MLSGAKIAGDNVDEAIERFGHFDTDKNGVIDLNEMKQAGPSMPAYLQESEFQGIDVNRDGRITIEEFDEDAGRAIQEKILQGVANKE
jgi:Ca2+-binding EF-hand superfamily protein